jgi:hypothetical protein
MVHRALVVAEVVGHPRCVSVQPANSSASVRARCGW